MNTINRYGTFLGLLNTIVVFLIVACGFTQIGSGVYKEYVGGRKGFSHVSLVLYTDSTYSFRERFDFPGTTRDSGHWKADKHNLILTSTARSRKDRIFNGDSFRIEDDVLFLFDKRADEVFNKAYRTLKEKR